MAKGKFDPNAITEIILRATGGEVGAASALAPKVGPLGLSPKKIGEDIKKNTMDWKGLRVTVKLIVQNRQAKVEVVPSAGSLVIRALDEGPKSGDGPRVHDGDLTYDQVYEIAKIMRGRSMSRRMAGTVKEILGTCFSVGCTVNGLPPCEVQKQIDNGEIKVEDYEAPVEEKKEE